MLSLGLPLAQFERTIIGKLIDGVLKEFLSLPGVTHLTSAPPDLVHGCVEDADLVIFGLDSGSESGAVGAFFFRVAKTIAQWTLILVQQPAAIVHFLGECFLSRVQPLLGVNGL